MIKIEKCLSNFRFVFPIFIIIFTVVFFIWGLRPIYSIQVQDYAYQLFEERDYKKALDYFEMAAKRSEYNNEERSKLLVMSAKCFKGLGNMYNTLIYAIEALKLDASNFEASKLIYNFVGPYGFKNKFALNLFYNDTKAIYINIYGDGFTAKNSAIILFLDEDTFKKIHIFRPMMDIEGKIKVNGVKEYPIQGPQENLVEDLFLSEGINIIEIEANKVFNTPPDLRDLSFIVTFPYEY